MKTIPIRFTEDEEENLWMTEGDPPVWPIAARAERDALLLTANLFDAVLDPTGSSQSSPITKSSWVAALGKDVTQEAHLYAYLTQRSFCLVERDEDLLGVPSLAVVVTTSERITAGLLNLLYNGMSTEEAPGIIYSQNPVSLRRQVLCRAAAAYLSDSAPTRRVDIFPLIPFEEVLTSERKVLSANSSAVTIRNALREGAGLVNLKTHSDGIDAYLGKELKICPLDHQVRGDLGRAPRCVVTGQCHRLNDITLDEAWASGFLMPPHRISARLLVWDTCYGILAMSSVIDAEWGIGAKLAHSATIGAALAPWHMAVTPPLNSQPLLEAIAEGIPVGRSLALFHQMRQSLDLSHRFCLLGDPQVLVKSTRNTIGACSPPVARKQSLRRGDRVRDKSATPNLDFIKKCLVNALAELETEVVPEVAGMLRRLGDRTLDRIYSYESGFSQASHAVVARKATGMRQDLCEYLSYRHWTHWISDWRRLSCRQHARPVRCLVCGNGVKSLIAEINIVGVPPRKLTICPFCDSIQDAPTGCSMAVVVERGLCVSIVGEMPIQQSNARLAIHSSHPLETLSLEWPIGADGAPSTSFRPKITLPPGPLFFTIAFVYGLNIALLTQRGRG